MKRSQIREMRRVRLLLILDEMMLAAIDLTQAYNRRHMGEDHLFTQTTSTYLSDLFRDGLVRKFMKESQRVPYGLTEAGREYLNSVDTKQFEGMVNEKAIT